MKITGRTRWLLTLLLLLLIGGAVPPTNQGGRVQAREQPVGGQGPSVSWANATRTPAQSSGAFTAAFAELAHEGTIGDVILQPDTADDPGGACATDRTLSPDLMQISVNMPAVTVTDGNAQTIRLVLDLYQQLPDGSMDYVGSGWEAPQIVNPGEYTTPDWFTLTDVPAGPRWYPVLTVLWYDDPNADPTGWIAYRIENFATWVNNTGTWESLPVSNACYPLTNPYASISPTSGTVNAVVTYRLYYFPVEVPVEISWDSKSLGSVTTDFYARASGTFKVPDGQVMGQHTVSFTAGKWKATRLFTVKPRIKVTPGAVARGEQVKISVRGYNAYEPVKIRWRDGTGTWREIARFTTSGTGSGQVYLPVPLFAPDGVNSVRGDSLNAGGARAQTNAVTVTGGTFRPAAAPSAPTPTPTPTLTPTPTATATVPTPASPTAETPTPAATEPVLEPTAEPTVQPPTEPATEPTVEPTPEPTSESITEPTIAPTIEEGADS
jgi:hypothetical protein